MSDKKKIVIVGGVAGGASAAARLRRLSESAEITVYEKSGYVSFANCGLPYHIGGAIKDRKKLLIQTPESFNNRFNVDVQVNTEVIAIDRENKEVTVRRQDGSEVQDSYDYLVLSPGASPIKPPIKGIDSEGVFTLRNIEDMDSIISYLNDKSVKNAVVIGGGYIGLEMAEAFVEKGVGVSLIEMAEQVFSPIDPEMATVVHQQLGLHGVDLRLGSEVVGIEKNDSGLSIELRDGNRIGAGVVVLAIGVKPAVELALACGLEIGERGGIKVDSRMKTDDDSIYAVGDAIEVVDFVGGFNTLIPLAGPANRQGRIASDNIMGRESEYHKTQGTAICKVFDLAVGMAGLSEKVLKRRGQSYRKIYVHPQSHAGYYPGATPITMKLLFDGENGKILGVQAVGSDGVDKRIDVIAVAMRAGLTVDKLEDLELSYAPPFGSAKDPVNYAGFVANNEMKGDVENFYPEQADELNEGEVLVDVRTAAEFEGGFIGDAVNIPVDELRERLDELDKDKVQMIYCAAGLRGYLACRILSQNGYRCKNMTGGYKSYKFYKDAGKVQKKGQSCLMNNKAAKVESENALGEIKLMIDACGLTCPGPAMKLKEGIANLNDGEHLQIETMDAGFATDVAAWCDSTGNGLVSLNSEAGKFKAVVCKGTESQKESFSSDGKSNKLTSVVFSGEFDKSMASFIIANGAAAAGKDVTLFFTFWGINLLRKPVSKPMSKNFIEKMFGFMMPKGAERAPLSNMNFLGAGRAMIKGIMRSKNVHSITQLIEEAKKNGVRLVVCSMSMDLMGIKKEELIDGVEEGGVALYINEAEKAGVNLFI